MAVRKQKRMNKETGKSEKSKSWYIFFHDHRRRLRSLSAGADLDEARRLERIIKALSKARDKGLYSDKIAEWIDDLPGPMRSKLSAWDLLPAAQVGAVKPLHDHIDDWQAALIAGGITPKQADLLTARCRRVFETAGACYWPDVQQSRILNVITTLRKLQRRKDKTTGKIKLFDTGRPLSSMSKLHYVRAVKEFARWMKRDGRAAQNPLDTLTIKGAAVEAQRRPLTTDEMTYLLEYADGAETRCKLTGPQRSLIYRLAVETGLRAAEIATLKRSNFDFDKALLHMDAPDTKNKKPATLPVKAATLERIKQHIKAMHFKPWDCLFNLPTKRAARMIQKDMTAARAAWIAAAETDLDEHRRRLDSDFLEPETNAGKADFHALRHTFATMLAAANVHPRTAMELLRHSKIELTMKIYTHTQNQQLTDAIAILPDFETAAAKAARPKIG